MKNSERLLTFWKNDTKVKVIEGDDGTFPVQPGEIREVELVINGRHYIQMLESTQLVRGDSLDIIWRLKVGDF